MKNEAAQAQGKNRQVLRDIGNLETLQVVEGKISRPMTRSLSQSLCFSVCLSVCVNISSKFLLGCRSYRAQLLANVQVVAEKNKVVFSNYFF